MLNKQLDHHYDDHYDSDHGDGIRYASGDAGEIFESVFLESVSFKCICAQLLVEEELIGTKLV